MSVVTEKFVFTWKIERFHMLPHKNDECIDSPTFSSKSFLNTKWYISLYPRGDNAKSDNFISCYLNRKSDDGPEYISVEFQLSVNSDTEKTSESFEKMDTFGFSNHFKRPNKYFYDNVCVVVCRMTTWIDSPACKLGTPNIINLPSFEKEDLLDPEIRNELLSSTEEELLRMRGNLWPCPKQCFIRTLISMERRFISCRMKDIACFGRTKFHLPVLSCTENPDFLIILHKTLNDEVENLEIKLCFIGKLLKNVLLVYKMQILDSEDEIYALESSHIFEKSKVHEIWNIGNNCEWGEVKNHENANLNFEISYSDGTLYSDIECTESEEYLSLTSTENLLSSDVVRLYNEKKLCDVTLQMNGRAFEAHKVVLCGSSPVFSAMLENNMKESGTNKVIIDDMNPDTVNQMLTFLYSGNIGKLEFAGAIHLFTVADKYQIAHLKKKCRTFLMENLSVENVISVLSLADAHHDKKLKESAIYFIYKNAVFLSPKWKNLSDSNSQLALEVFQDIHSKYL